MKYLLFFFSFVLLVCLTKGDLPIHALMGDVIGVWEIKETKSMSERAVHCGGGIPNRNLENLSSHLKDYEKFLKRKYGNINKILVKLTMEKIKVANETNPRNKWTYLAVRSVNNNAIIGYWTMVYDEGFEIRLKGRRYFGLFKYEKRPSESCPEAIENKNEKDSRCYKTDPTKTHIGWVLDEQIEETTREKKFQWGCFYGQKDQKTDVSAFVIHNEKKIPEHDNNNLGGEIKSEEEKGLSFSVLTQRANYQKIRLALEKLYGKTKTSLANIYGDIGDKIYGCHKQDIVNLKIRLTLPKNFTWGDPYTDENFNEEVDEQRDCGSCYSISSVYILEKRFEIMSWKKYKKKINIPKLSYQSVISCSPYNQGCDGGFPFLVGKHMYEFGILSESLMKYENNDTVKCKMNIGTYNSSYFYGYYKNKTDDIFYASNYNYINGCYECSNEYDMMNEILMNGPIVAAINATPQLLNLYNLNDKNIVYDTVTNENQVCDVPNEGFNGWQQTNHAIAIVGWGEQTDENNKLVKYWIIRNTWGNKWGYKGYLKFQRGINLAGIESQAVFIDPDFSRGRPKELLAKQQA
ncbi:dipeptidyl aminopeptidase 2, putative [Plasmodium malariae]|uniref:Dipeptidyl peptidase 1 n=3 Tax=Plasmodium (Plasmodium) TaxID=418103 RepID=A0A1D3TFK8_PLAMA|nr:dipeptidyl aminopeptidase 2, putative [Plasmodium malariae]SCP03749.1 dipeptidyl aminopeptidase 2, putative [Plasmodium malariae]